MVQSSTAENGSESPDLTGRWVLSGDGAGAARFTTRHLFGLQAVRGTFDVQRAEVIVGPDQRADLVVDVAAGSFSTGHKKRDPDVRSGRFLDTDNYQLITFRASGLDTAGSTFTVPGTLRVKENEAPVTVTGTVEHTGPGTAVLTGETSIDRYEHQVTAGKGMVARRLHLQVTLPLQRL